MNFDRAIVVAALALAGCSQTPTTPSASAGSALFPQPSSGPTPPFSLSGVVFESIAGGVRPMAGIPLDISSEIQTWSPRTSSDGQGRYSVSGLNAQALKVAAITDDYSQPCRAAINVTQDSTLDIYLVSNSVLATRGVPASLPVVEPTLTGRVLEPTSTGMKPAAGGRVYVDFSGGLGIAASANTVTDPSGRYLLCNVRDVGVGLTVNAHKYPLYSKAVSVPTPITAQIDLELFAH